MSGPTHAFALTICAYRKPGMDESAYHKYLSENHASTLKDLLIKNQILEYTMVNLLPSHYPSTSN